MRRIVVGLLFAALVYWAWSSFRGTPANAAPPPERADLAAMLASTAAGSGAEAPTAVPPVTAPELPPSAPAVVAAAEIESAFAALVQGLKAGDPEARRQAERLLGRDDLADAHRAQLRSLLGLEAATVDDIDVALQRLGSNNTFLHSVEGRALARRALELLKGLDSDRAVQAGSDLLERCMRGRIERKDTPAIELVDEAYKAYRPLADRVLCDPANLARARSYTVVAGDNLEGIAKRFRREGIAIDQGSLAILNRISNPNSIRPGQRIRVPLDAIHAVVEKRSFLMAVYLGERVLRLYWVGHGADDKTPVAEFTISEKLKDPDWDAPDGRRIPFGSPENILGRYFLKFEHPSYAGFGAHGTPMPETIGTMSSAGCIRMRDNDIEELFRLLPRQAKVNVRDSY